MAAAVVTAGHLVPFVAASRSTSTARSRSVQPDLSGRPHRRWRLDQATVEWIECFYRPRPPLLHSEKWHTLRAPQEQYDDDNNENEHKQSAPDVHEDHPFRSATTIGAGREPHTPPPKVYVSDAQRPDRTQGGGSTRRRHLRLRWGSIRARLEDGHGFGHEPGGTVRNGSPPGGLGTGPEQPDQHSGAPDGRSRSGSQGGGTGSNPVGGALCAGQSICVDKVLTGGPGKWSPNRHGASAVAGQLSSDSEQVVLRPAQSSLRGLHCRGTVAWARNAASAGSACPVVAVRWRLDRRVRPRWG